MNILDPIICRERKKSRLQEEKKKQKDKEKESSDVQLMALSTNGSIEPRVS